MLITGDIEKYLLGKEFINVGTCDIERRPNVAPKFILKIEDDCIYLVDYVIGRTFRNIKENSKVSLATVNMDTLIGYQLNGVARIIDKGAEYRVLSAQARKRKVEFSVQRVIANVRKEKKGEGYEVVFPENVVIFKVEIEEVVQIRPSGQLERKRREDSL